MEEVGSGGRGEGRRAGGLGDWRDGGAEEGRDMVLGGYGYVCGGG